MPMLRGFGGGGCGEGWVLRSLWVCMSGSPCQDQAVKLLPTGYTLLKDAFNGRWRVDSRLFTCSRSV